MLKLSCFIFISAHLLTCLLYVVSQWEEASFNWIDTARVDPNILWDVYIAGLYWLITTMVTVGYGDIAPVTTNERIVMVVVMLASSIVFGYILSSIGGIIVELSNYSSENK